MQYGKSFEIFAQKLTRFYRYADQEAQATASGGHCWFANNLTAAYGAPRPMKMGTIASL
jgi:hypothetical protein